MNDTVEMLQINLAMFVASVCVLCVGIFTFANIWIFPDNILRVLGILLTVILVILDCGLMGLSAAGIGQYFYIRATERSEVT